jgi:hypothetical protein
VTLRQRNNRFKRDLPVYRLALRAWMWGGKKKANRGVVVRWSVILRLEETILNWQVHENFITRSFIEPPDRLIKEVLTWEL